MMTGSFHHESRASMLPVRELYWKRRCLFCWNGGFGGRAEIVLGPGCHLLLELTFVRDREYVPFLDRAGINRLIA